MEKNMENGMETVVKWGFQTSSGVLSALAMCGGDASFRQGNYSIFLETARNG